MLKMSKKHSDTIYAFAGKECQIICRAVLKVPEQIRFLNKHFGIRCDAMGEASIVESDLTSSRSLVRKQGGNQKITIDADEFFF
jgi:hypothetical protein